MSIHSLNKRRADRNCPAFIPSGSRNVPDVIYVVLDEDSEPRYSHTDRTMAHHWINSAMDGSEEAAMLAKHWVVREYRLVKDKQS